MSPCHWAASTFYRLREPTQSILLDRCCSCPRARAYDYVLSDHAADWFIGIINQQHRRPNFIAVRHASPSAAWTPPKKSYTGNARARPKSRTLHFDDDDWAPAADNYTRKLWRVWEHNRRRPMADFWFRKLRPICIGLDYVAPRQCLRRRGAMAPVNFTMDRSHYTPTVALEIQGTGALWGKQETDQNVLPITKAFIKTTNCICRAKKVEGHDKKIFPALCAWHVLPLWNSFRCHCTAGHILPLYALGPHQMFIPSARYPC